MAAGDETHIRRCDGSRDPRQSRSQEVRRPDDESIQIGKAITQPPETNNEGIFRMTALPIYIDGKPFTCGRAKTGFEYELYHDGRAYHVVSKTDNKGRKRRMSLVRVFRWKKKRW